MKIRYYFDYFFIFLSLIGSSIAILHLFITGSSFSALVGIANFIMSYIIAQTMIADKEGSCGGNKS